MNHIFLNNNETESQRLHFENKKLNVNFFL